MKEKQASFRTGVLIPASIPGHFSFFLLTALLLITSLTACGRSPGTIPENAAGSSVQATGQSADSQQSASETTGPQASASPTTAPQTDIPAPETSGGCTPPPTTEPSSASSAKPSPTAAVSLSKSQPGAILDESIDKALLVRLLMMEDYSLKGFQASFGTDPVQSADGAYEMFSYPNGVYFEIMKDGTVAEFGSNNGAITLYPDQIQRMKVDVLGNPGEEWLILYEYDLYYRLLVLDGATESVLREYETGYLNLLEVKIGDFLREGSLQLYIDGYADGTEKRAIYRVVADDFIQVFDIGSFSQYKDGIKAIIAGSLLNLDVQLEGYPEKKQSQLPERIYYDNRGVADKNSLLSIHPSWHLLEKNGLWFVNVRNSVDFDMLGYYWGPPMESVEDNSMMLNDLARVDLLLAMDHGVPKTVEVRTSVKYDNPMLLSVKPIGREEGRLLNGPVLESTMEEAFTAAGGDTGTFEYAEQLTVNGVSLFEFTGSIVDITVLTKSHSTTRGMKVGDTIQTVELLYGKPDVGFSGDETVSYKSIYEYQGKPQVNYYRGMDVSYKDGVVKSFTLYQVILD